ncbi:uncharacterized protein LOC113871680 [Abrus precatorius]|uniref:Uncharacterized protein LOC113871680 n=1 Tax=Abrus precatorius TaxID=3816 RepID=A0A8B8M7S8_ABRPR|nr:uncharacterized protein LOC113871680 [Abrus precatorius]
MSEYFPSLSRETMSSASSMSFGTTFSNLDTFLLRVTPDVPSHTLHIQKCCSDLNRQWLPPGNDTIEYFNLNDLWNCYCEWSAYGAGTPVTLESGDTVMQYHVPYLSAIQIYSSKSVATSRIRREDSEGAELESDSLSEESGSYLSRSLSNNSSKAWDAVSLDSSCDIVGSWPTRDMLGYLYLQYNETSPPFRRVPFVEKIFELAKSHPALMTLKSVDISPASWMAVSWYPIYPIPSQKGEKNLAASFLTYHTLSSSFQDCTNNYDDTEIGENLCCLDGMRSIIAEKCNSKNSGCISLSPFGLATYKMRRDIWLNPSDNGKVLDLYSAADSWLKQLNTYHHDFKFFSLRYNL